MSRLWDKIRGRKQPTIRSIASGAKVAARKPVSSPFAAVAIQTSSDQCCPAAKQIAGQRFLAKDAPLLRLPDCSNPQCGCRYVRFDDRREGARRVVGSDVGLQLGGSESLKNSDRRLSRGRRAGDVNWAR